MPRNETLYRFCLIVGTWLPVLGVLLLGTYFFTQWSSLLFFGFVFLLCALLVGCLALSAIGLLYFRKKQDNAEFFRSHKLVKPTFLVLFSFFVGIACAVGGIQLMDMVHVKIRNEFSERVDGVTFVDPRGNLYPVGSMNVASEASKRFFPKGEGAVKIQVESLGKEKVVIGYITNGSGGTARVLISQVGEIEVH